MANYFDQFNVATEPEQESANFFDQFDKKEDDSIVGEDGDSPFKDRQRDLVHRSLKRFGASDVATAALLGDIEQESSFNPTLPGDNNTSWGLFQTGTPMYRQYNQEQARNGIKPGTDAYLYNQAPFVISRFQKQHPDRWEAMQNAPDAPTALDIFRSTPDWGYGIAGKRHDYANAYQQAIQNFTATAPLIAGAPTVASVQAGQDRPVNFFDQFDEGREPTPTPQPPPAPTPEGGGFLEQMRAMFAGARPATTEEYRQQVSPVPQEVIEAIPEAIKKPIRGVGQYVSEMLPRTGEDWVRAAGIPTDWTDPRQVAGFAFPMVRGMGGIDLPEHVRHRAEAIQAAEETPPFSQERWTAGLGPFLDIGQIAAGAPLEGVPRVAGRAARPLPEAIARQREAQMRAAVKGAPEEVISETARPAPELPATEEKFNPETLKREPKTDRDFWFDGLDLRQSVVNGLRRLGVDVAKTDLPNPEQFSTGKEFFYAMRDAEARMRQSGAKAAGFVFQERGQKPPRTPTTEETAYARQEPSPKRLPSAQVRPEVDEGAPLRQPGEIAELRGEEEVPRGGAAPEVAARERVGLTVDEARQIYDEAVAESKMTPAQMAEHRGMSEAYQAQYPFAAEYNIKHAQEVAAIPFKEHLAKLKKAGKLQEAATPEAETKVVDLTADPNLPPELRGPRLAIKLDDGTILHAGDVRLHAQILERSGVDPTRVIDSGIYRNISKEFESHTPESVEVFPKAKAAAPEAQASVAGAEFTFGEPAYHGNTQYTLHKRGNNIEVSQINANTPAGGMKFLRDLTQWADANGLTLSGDARPMTPREGVRQLPQDKLKRLYRQFGFEEYGQHDRMMRIPKTQEVTGGYGSSASKAVLSTQDAVSQAVDLVGKNEFARMVDQRLEAFGTEKGSPQEATHVENLARKIVSEQPPKPPAPPAVEAPAPYTREAAEARATGIKNVVTAAEREERGIAPAEQAAVRDFGTVWDDAATVAQKDPEIGRRLVDELQEKPRPLSDTEDALLLRRQIEVQNEHDAAIRAVNESPGDPLAEARLASARDQVQKVYDAGKSAGTETGRGLNARKMLATNDFSLVKMEAETRAVANGGRPLSKPQLDEVKALHERIATAEAKVAGFEAKEAFEAALKEAKAAGKTKGFKVQEFLDQQAQRARERIVARRGKLYADPIGVTQVAHLADEAIIGASHIARGVTKFADWSAAMIREFGENIKPFLKDLYKRAQAIASEGTKTSKLTPEERMQRALAGDVKRIQTRTEQVREKLAKGDFEKPVRKPPRMSPEKSAAMFQYAKAKEAYHHALIKAQRAARPMWRKAVGGAEEAVATARAVKTAYDLSAVLRQGGAQVMAHPIRARNAFARMIESLKSDEGMFRINEEIKSRPNAQNGRYAQYKLFLADPEVGASLGKMEEVYSSRLAKHIPGVRMSERGYVTFLNVMRADSMDALINAFETPNRKLTLNEGRALANYVNIATGRGNLGKLGAAARPLSLGLFAPRYMLSRFQYLLGQPMWGGSMRTRMLIAREYGQTAMGVGVIVALGLAAGATMETDSKSTDFGKLKFGNTRIDPWFGLQQHMVYLSRLWAGKRKTAEGKIVAVRGPKAKYGEADITGRFLRSKAAPVPGAIMDLYYGKDYVGNEVTPLSAAANLVSPLSMQDIFKVMVDQGVPVGTAMGLLSFFGMGVSTYGPHKKKFKAGPVKNPYPEGTGRVSP